MSYLLDTNTVSELRKRKPDPRVTSWFDLTPTAELYLSCLTVGEIRRGIERLRGTDEGQAKAIERWLTGLRTGEHARGADTFESGINVERVLSDQQARE